MERINDSRIPRGNPYLRAKQPILTGSLGGPPRLNTLYERIKQGEKRVNALVRPNNRYERWLLRLLLKTELVQIVKKDELRDKVA